MTGAWIWDAFHRETPNQLLRFRRVLGLERPAVSGTIAVAARGAFRVAVDGVLVAHHDVQSSVPGAESVDVDLTPALAGRSGRVVITIGVLLLGIGTHHQARALGGLFVTGSVRDADGREYALDSSAGWESTTPPPWRQAAPQSVWSAGHTEWSDRTEEEDGGWGAAVVYPDEQVPVRYDRRVVETPVDLLPSRIEHGTVTDVGGGHVGRAAECVALGRRRIPGGIGGIGGDGGYDLVLLPSEHVGFVELDVEADEPTTIDVITGETVDDSGWPAATRQGIAAIDTVVVPAGRTVHRFWNRRAFRSLAVIARPAAVRVRALTMHAVTAARPAASFRTGVERWDEMLAVSERTAAIGRQDHYEDCPLREGGHYVADARVQAILDVLTTGATDLAHRSVRQFAAAQDPDGMIPALSPSGTHHRIPDFALQWVSYLEDVLRLTGDDALAAELLPAVVRTIDWATAHVDESTGHLDVDEPGWWPFIDWYDFGPEALTAALDAQYLVAVQAAADLCARAGDTARAAEYRARVQALLNGMTPTGHPHAAVILLTGLPPEDARHVVAPDALDGFRVETGYFAFWLALAHLARGRADLAEQLVEDYWGSMLDAGATTWWERWSPEREVVESTGSSLCHPWSAGPLVLIPILVTGENRLARTR